MTDDRFERGRQALTDLNGEETAQRVLDSLADISPKLADSLVAWGFGEIYSRPQLVPRDRQLVTLGMLTALGGGGPHLQVPVKASPNAGTTPARIARALL